MNYLDFWNLNFPMTPHVRPLVGLSVGRLVNPPVIICEKGGRLHFNVSNMPYLMFMNAVRRTYVYNKHILSKTKQV